MSEQFENKEYGEYFNLLEKRISQPKKENIKETVLPKKQKKGKFRFKKSVMALLSVFLLGAIVISAFSLGGKENKKENIKPSKTVTKEEEKISKISFSFKKDIMEIPTENDAKSAVIINCKTGEVIAHRNAHERLYPASTTKIMTLLVAVENIKDMDDVFTMSYAVTDPLYLADASTAGFLNGESINMTDLLYGTILPSGADAAMGVALKVAGSEEEFVKLMNQKVKELGLKNTNFQNVTGLHHENNYSSSYDMAVILAAAMKNDLCKKILSTYKYTTAFTEQHPEGIELTSTLFKHMYGTEPETATILGGKTGYVYESGYCIATFGKNNTNNTEYIVVTLGNSARLPAFLGQIDLYKQFVK